jgi:hypothetical protein
MLLLLLLLVLAAASCIGVARLTLFDMFFEWWL